MALIVNQIQTLWRGNAGNLIASQNQVISGFMGVGRAAQGSSRQMSLMDQQTRAFGTTLRYAFAGTVIFGVTSLIGKLSQLQQQMGLISAIAGPAGVNMGRGGLTDLEDALSAKAVDARTNLTDLNSATINFLSTVQGAKSSTIPGIISSIGLAATISQTPTEDLTKAVTTLNIAANRPNNLKNINGLLREWFKMISTVPGGISAAPQIANQLGPLSSIAQSGRLTPEQLFTFSTAALRFGATPSTGLRGTQYFLQSLLTPKGAQAKALSAAGFTPERMQQEGGAKFILDYLKYVRGLGVGRATRGQIGQFGAMVDANPDTEAGLAPNQNVPGFSPQALKFANATIGRIHGIRTLFVLMNQLVRRENVTSLTDLFTNMDQLFKGIGKDKDQLARAEQRYRDATPLQGAAIALDTLRQTVGRDTAHILNPAAKVIGRGAMGLTGHPNVRHGLEIGGAAFLAALGIRSFRRRGLPGIFGLGGMAGQGFVTEQAIAAAGGTGGHRSGQTPLDSLYVTVVGQVFPSGGGAGGGGIPGVPGGLPTPVILGARFGRFAPLLRAAGPVAAAAIMADITRRQAPKSWQDYSWGDVGHELIHPRSMNLFGWHPFGGGRGHPAMNAWDAYPRASRAAAGVLNRQFINPSLHGFSNLFTGMAGMTGPPNAQLGFPDMLSVQMRGLHAAQRAAQNFKFKADGDLAVQIIAIDPTANTVRKRRVHLATSIYSGGNVPSTRGKRKSALADFTGKH